MPGECHHLGRPPHSQDQPDPPGGGPQKGHGQCLIIAAQGGPSNVAAFGGAVKLKLGNEFERAVPSAPIARRRPTEPQQVGAHADTEPRLELGQQLDARPGAQVARIAVGGIVVHSEARLRDIIGELGACEREQRPHQAAAAARRHPGQPREPAPLEQAQQNRLDLIVTVMPGDEIARRVAAAHFAEPGVARAACGGLRCGWTEVELAQLERHAESSRQPAYHLSHLAAFHLNAVIRVRHHERQPALGRDHPHQGEQRHRVGAAGDGEHGGTRRGEEPGPVEMRAKAVEQRSHIDNDILATDLTPRGLGMRPDETYQLLRNLTSPIVAITCERAGKGNGMISDSAVRASIVPTIPRVSVYIHKFNFSHDLIFDTGRFVMHLLRTDQFELVHRLGFTSGRERDKLGAVPHHPGTLGVPVLDECYAHFECRVANVMDTGSSTCFLGDVVEVGHGASSGATGTVMTAAYFRENMPPQWRAEYEALLAAAQRFAAERSRHIKPVIWRDLPAPK